MKTAPKLLIIGLISLIVATGGIVAYRHYGAKQVPIARPRLAIQIGEAKLLVPAALVRNPERRVSGKTNRLDLIVSWPGFEPPDPPTASDRVPPTPNFIFVSLEEADGAIDPGQRPKELYSRFLEADVENGPGSLLRRDFKATSAYGGEYLVIAPPEGETFSARCLSGEAVESASGRCLWQFRYGALDVLVRFSPAVLPNWERLNDSLRQLIQRIYLEQ